MPTPDPIVEEDTPLLAGAHVRSPAACDALLRKLDSVESYDEVHDEPPSPHVHRVKSALQAMSGAPGLGHPLTAHAQSPALVLRMRHALDNGVHVVLSGMHAHLRPPTAASSGVRARRRVVRAVFVVAVLTMLAMTSLSPTLLLFMNQSGFTSAADISPYVKAAALATAIPIVSNIVLTALAGRLGPGRALSVGALVAAAGLVLMMVVRRSLLMFYLGYALYACCNSFRVIRVSLLSKVVPPAERTTVLAAHALMTPIGALLGPSLWLVAQMYRERVVVLGFVIDRFSITYASTVLAFGGIIAVSLLSLTRIVPHDAEEQSEEEGGAEDSGEAPVTREQSGADSIAPADALHGTVLQFADGRRLAVDLRTYKNFVFVFFCGIMLGLNISAGVYMTAFQPILVNVYQTSDAKLGMIFELIAVFAIIPPLLVAALSRFLKDRDILVIGLVIKLVGMALFQPFPFAPAVYEWQVIVGFMLIIKASIFFTTASLSLFTKLLASMSNSVLLGILASASAVGPALVQIALSDAILAWFGSWRFAIFAVPAFLSLVAIVWPSMWKRLDPDKEFSRLIRQEADIQQQEALHQA